MPTADAPAPTPASLPSSPATTSPYDPARWLRGATSAGDPHAWAVREVLDELERLRAMERRAAELHVASAVGGGEFERGMHTVASAVLGIEPQR